jgi:hypothetical protein
MPEMTQMSDADVARWTAIGLHTIAVFLALGTGYASLDDVAFAASNVLGVVLLRTPLFESFRGVCVLVVYELVVGVASAAFLTPDLLSVIGIIVLSMIYVAWLRSNRQIAINAYVVMFVRCLAAGALAFVAIALAVSILGVAAVLMPTHGVTGNKMMLQLRIAELISFAALAFLVSFPIRQIFPRFPAYWAFGCFLAVFVLLNIPFVLESLEEFEAALQFEVAVFCIFVLGVPGIIWLTGRSRAT